MTPIDVARQEYAARVQEPAAFDRYSGGRPDAWCANFVSWCFAQAGRPLPGYFFPRVGPGGSPPTASCSRLAVKVRDTGGLLMPPTITPRANDMIFYKYVDPSTRQFQSPGILGLPFIFGHIGLVEGIDEKGRVVSIEGNYNNRVERVHTRRNSDSIAAYARFPANAGASLFGGGGSGANLFAAGVLGVGAALLIRSRRKT